MSLAAVVFDFCIGPVAAATARRLGLHVDVEAAEHTINGLVDALAEHLTP